jgi:hypothetical protein
LLPYAVGQLGTQYSVRSFCLKSEALMKQRDRRIVETPVEARQGFLGRPVLIVLVGSCTLAIVALALSFVGLFGHA